MVEYIYISVFEVTCYRKHRILGNNQVWGKILHLIWGHTVEKAAIITGKGTVTLMNLHM